MYRCIAVLILSSTMIYAQRGFSRSSVNRNFNANRNVNVNQNFNANRNVNVNKVNVNRDVDVHGGYYGGGCCYHPGATAAAVTATAVTAAAIGSMVQTLPPSCSAVMVNGVTYQQCGSAWYEPQFVGTNVNYVVVAAPR